MKRDTNTNQNKRELNKNSRMRIVHSNSRIEAERAENDRLQAELRRTRSEVESAYQALAEINKDITDSINYSRRIQDAILPEQEILRNFMSDSFFMYNPKDIVSGDFYWFTQYDNKIIVAVADCTGHGVPGAFMSMIGHNLLNEIVHVKDITQPNEILSRLDRGLRKLLKQDSENSSARDGMDIAICSIDPENNLLEFAGANRQALVFSKGMLQELRGERAPVGGAFRDGENRYTNHTMRIEKGDQIYLFTDGLTDQFGGPNNKKLMGKRFRQLLNIVNPLKMAQQKRIISKFFSDWKGNNSQTDDVLLIGMTI